MLRRTQLRRGPWNSPAGRKRSAARRLRTRMKKSAGPWFPAYDHAAFVRRQDCALRGVGAHRCSRWGGVEAAHYERRSRGGDWTSQVPLCRAGHRLLDVDCRNRWQEFEERTGINLPSIAATYVDRAVRLYGLEDAEE